ncbi:PIN domain-containing protein [Candidatus Gottesmanbacteria bacterium]|nr:PIN domain-containing protein [Candidatus Gottesmanbacteria bacterium]
MKTCIAIDTNIILRFLLKDHPQLSEKAKQLFSQAGKGACLIYLDEVIIAEVVWVLFSFYKKEKTEIIEQLTMLITQPWIVNNRKHTILAAFEMYRLSNFAYIDCWIYTVSKQLNYQFKTFDERLEKLHP